MSARVSVIADDLTGACDVGGELAEAGYDVRVLVDAAAPASAPAGCLTVANTQSRALPVPEAAARVRAAVARGRADVLLKKIDTALRGHLGAELAAALEASGARAAFVLAAIPAAGRVTRGGCQWFDGRPLASTEFAHDPEGRAGTSSIPAVLARESGWPCAVIDVGTVRGGGLRARTRALLGSGARFVVVDAESESDVEQAVGAILELPPPLCLAGSVSLARALARQAPPGAHGTRRRDLGPLPAPALIVSGSLHSRARAQLEAVIGAGLGEWLPATASGGVAGEARRRLDAGRSVVIAPEPTATVPTPGALREMEERLAALTRAIVAAGPVASLVLIGGETSYAILRSIEAGELALRGRPALLIARAEIVAGPARGTLLLTKGGSGGEAGDLTGLMRAQVLP